MLVLFALVAGAAALVAPATSTRRSAVVTMATGSQVPLRIKNKRLKNQEKDRMRLNIFKSNQHIYAQVVDDVEQKTLASASTLDIKADFAENKKNAGANVDASAKVGALLAARCKEANIEMLYYDRFSGSHKYLYHGRVKALVESVREGGITI
ncbi:hypothetical protein M885DRAFT_436405 [Pelagophyceae sp. CCMP2097]|nr:hypothetical protein M885DRAFT_436405 [Pelagophyceae sp. CCMP2097]